MRRAKLIFISAFLACGALGTSMAEEQQKQESEGIDTFYEQLRRGREPRLSLQSEAFDQEGTNFSLRGLTNSASLKFDPVSFLTLFGTGGVGAYWAPNDRAQDNFISGGGQLRLHSVHWLEGEAGYYSLGAGDALFRAQYGYQWRGSPFWMTVGAKKEFVWDSFLSLVGQTVQGQSLGAARAEKAFAEVGTHWGILEMRLAPHIGQVAARSLPVNNEVGAEAAVSLAVIRTSSSTVSLAYHVQAEHYDQDQSGFTPSVTEPLPGGYFSPQAFVSQTPELAFKGTGEHHTLEWSAGPSFQYVKTNPSPETRQLGAEANFSWLWQITRGLAFRVGSQYLKIAQVYDRLALNGELSYAF